MCQAVLLSAKGTTHITYCRRCSTIYIWHGAIVLTFKRRQFQCFLTEVQEMLGREVYMRFPDGESRVVMTTPTPELFFTFSASEWTNFVDSLEEGNLMSEVYELMP